MSTSDRIRELRKAKDVTQQELADNLKMNQSVVNRIERGTRPLRDDELKALAQYFGVSTDYLLGNEAPHSQSFSEDETRLVHMYRRLNDADRHTAFRILSSLSSPAFAHI